MSDFCVLTLTLISGCTIKKKRFEKKRYLTRCDLCSRFDMFGISHMHVALLQKMQPPDQCRKLPCTFL